MLLWAGCSLGKQLVSLMALGKEARNGPLMDPLPSELMCDYEFGPPLLISFTIQICVWQEPHKRKYHNVYDLMSLFQSCTNIPLLDFAGLVTVP